MTGRQTAVDERTLVTGLQAGAQWARRTFFEQAHDAVFANACRLIRDPDLRRDWTHDTLIRLADDVAAGRFVYRRPGSFWAWFRVRAPFVLLTCLRNRRRLDARELSRDDATVAAGAEPPAADDPAQDAENLEVIHAIMGCLDALANDDQRRAMSLLLLEELSYEEIAESLERPLNTVRTDIRRGRLALRECLIVKLELEP